MGKVLDRQDTYKGSAWDPSSQNLYVYVSNNPVNYIDPSGHCLRAVDDAALGRGGLQSCGGMSLETMIAIGNYDLALHLQANSGAALSMGEMAGKVLQMEVAMVAPMPQVSNGSIAHSEAPELSACRINCSAAASFKNGQYSETVQEEDMTVYRAEGGTSGQYGRFYGTQEPQTAADAEAMYNVAVWGNELTTVSTYNIPAGTTVYVGPVAGGTGTQAFVPNPMASGVQLRQSGPLPSPGF